MASRVPKVVEAERFVVRDENGAVRAELGPNLLGYGLHLFDADGKTRASLAMGPQPLQSVGLKLSDTGGKTRATFSVMAVPGFEAVGGTPHLNLVDANGTPRITAWLLADGSASLEVADVEGKTRVY